MDASGSQEVLSVGTETRCGYVAFLGVPNAGKSTLFNALVGENLSITAQRPQTTQRRITGIRTLEGRQYIFLDVPGMLEARGLLQRSFVMAAMQAIAEADVLLLVMDPVRSTDPSARELLREAARKSRSRVIGVITKVDQADEVGIEKERRWLEDEVGITVQLVSPPEGLGIHELLEAIGERLPAGPFLFPEDDLAIDSERFFVAELVRQVIFERYHDELPYAAFCEVEEFREGGDRLYIQVTIYVERKSQKGIIIGAGGTAIRDLGTEARSRIEHFLNRRVYLDLWVKVLPGWRKKRGHLRRLGFAVPEEDENPERV